MAAVEQPIIRRIIKKKGAHPHHGGAWKVAYADFVTAMMALFIVLWLLTQADTQVKQQVAQYFRNPGVVTGGALVGTKRGEASEHVALMEGSSDFAPPEVRAEQEELEREAKAVEATVANLAQESPELADLKNEVRARVTDEGLVIEIVDRGRNLLFDSSSAQLKPGLVKALRRIGGLLARIPNPIQIGGHTDSRPFAAGSSMSNWDLSYARAEAARRVLQSSGLRQGRIVRLDAFGDSDLLNKADPLAPENRRLSILAARRRALPTGIPRQALIDGLEYAPTKGKAR